MRVEFKIGDIEAVAKTDIEMPWSISDREIAAVKAAMFIKLTNEAKAEAQAIEARNKALASSRALIEYEMVKTWDGKLPVQMLGNSPVPFLNLDGVKK